MGKLRTLLCIILLSTMVCSIVGAATVTRDGRPNNPYGQMLFCDGSEATDGYLLHFKYARDFAGEWGYVRTGMPITLDPARIESYVRCYSGLRAMHLTPICAAFRAPDSYYENEERDAPRRDPDGSLTTFAKLHEDWARALRERRYHSLFRIRQ